MNVNSSYEKLKPSKELEDFIDSYFESKNLTSESLQRSIFSDGFFKLIITLIDGKIANLFLTGFWSKEIGISEKEIADIKDILLNTTRKLNNLNT